MKLKNKKTGAIYKIEDIDLGNSADGIWLGMTKYNSLAELNEEWEDYIEPTTYYYISDFGAIREGDVGKFVEDEIVRKEIGNYFETKEEAELAVRKLKAWKRLKDKGFRFEGWDNTDHSTIHNFSLFVAIEDLESINKDLDLLFGGEE